MKTNLLKKLLSCLTLIIIVFNVKAQSHQWSTSVGSTGQDLSNEIQRDASGNVLTVGSFSLTVDFDPGVGVSNLTATGINPNGYVLKQTNIGAFVWARAFVGAGTCNATAITTDAAGNVYVTGIFSGVIDFDPGAGTYTLGTSSTTDNDLFTCKLSSTGAFLWANRVGNIFDDGGTSIAIDGTNNVFVAGYCNASGLVFTTPVDLNPGPATATFNIDGPDGILIKLDNSGNYLQGQDFGTFGRDYINKVRIDVSNNVYIGGSFEQQIPYLAMTTYTTAVGYAYIAKLSNTFTKLWGIEYHGGSSVGNAVMDLAIDASGNVYSTGLFKNTIDFDPSTTTSYTMAAPSTTDYDVFVTKLSPTGGFLWADKIAAGIGNSSGTGISLDPISNVFVTGYFVGTADFNPSGTAYNKTSAGSNDIFVCKLNSAGVFSNDVQTYGSTGSDVGQSILCAGTGNYYLTGYFAGVVDFNAGTATNTLSSAGGLDPFVAYYTSCSVPPLTTPITPSLITVCANTSTVLSVTAASGVVFDWYAGAAGGPSLGTGNSFTTPLITTATDFWAEGTNTCAATARTQFSINIVASPTVGITSSSSSVCAGSTATLTASGATSYIWSTGATTTVTSVSPTITTIYTATGTAANGCKDTQTISIVSATTPTVNVTASSPSICSGSSTSLTASGANTYSWSSGGSGVTIAVSPTITTIYTATGTAVSGCRDTQTISISVSANPTVAVTASSPSLCSGSSTSLTASGASTYSWSTGATTTVTAVSPSITTVYTATGTAASGCKDTQTISVSVTTTPTLSTAHYTICAGGTATLSASGASTYSWSTGATTSSITVSPASNTTYTVTGNNGSCSDVNTVSVTVGSSISIAVTPTAPAVCIGNTLTLSATGATSYTWSTGSNSTAIAVSPTVNTTYTINGTSGSCSGTRTITVVANANPTVVATSSSSAICTGGTAILNATGATSYIWNPGSLPGATVAITPTLTTTYSVVGTSASGCTDTKTISITVSACTGINETQNANDIINIYPNPSNGEFTLNVHVLGTYMIINSIGQTVATIEVKENSQTISVMDLADGIYYVIGKSSKAKIVVGK